MIRVYELTGDSAWLQIATDTAHQLHHKYWDDENGGFFTVAHTSQQLIVRQKDLMDNATPSSNSVAAMALLRLSAITGDSHWKDVAIDTLRLLVRVAPSAPSAFCHALAASVLLADGSMEVVLPGHMPDFVREYRSQWRPHSVVAWGTPQDTPLWHQRQEGVAYVCRGHECLLPAHTLAEFRERLATNGRGE